MGAPLSKALSYFRIDAVPGYSGRLIDKTFVPQLTGLRGVAALIVLNGHLFERVYRFKDMSSLTATQAGAFKILETAFSGCCLFFCLSGYSLFMSLRRKEVSNFIVYSRDTVKRIARLSPPYFCILITTFLFISMTGYHPAGTRQFDDAPKSLTASLFASLVFGHDYLYGTFPRLFPPGWFMEVQVQFYIVTPLLYYVYIMIKQPIKRIAIGLINLAVCMVVSYSVSRADNHGLNYSIIAFLPYFWLGILIADKNRSFGLRSGLNSSVAGRLSGWVGLVGLLVLGVPSSAEFVRMAAQMVCLFLMLDASFVDGCSFQRAMSGRWLARIGIASYSVYLVHLQTLQVVIPAIVRVRLASITDVMLVSGVLGTVLVFIVAVVFYWLVERPCVAIAHELATSPGRSPNG